LLQMDVASAPPVLPSRQGSAETRRSAPRVNVMLFKPASFHE
jgi:hypothetical protein